ncbi:hypothetical protein AAGK42_26115 [Klebsiella pneumoniae]
MAHDVPLGCAPDEYDDLISGTCSHLPVVSAATMGTLAAVFGTFVGGTQAGANGGVLGFGLFGNLVGMFVGLVGGAILGAGCGLAWGWDGTMAIIEAGAQGLVDGTFVVWK